jgi:hypothetical protein
MQSGQFDVPTCPKVLPELGPRLQTRAGDDPQEMRAQVHRGRAVPRDHEDFARLSDLVDRPELAGDLWEQGRESDSAVPVPSRLFRTDPHSIPIPQNIVPCEPKHLAGAAEPAVPSEHDHEPPLSIGALVEDPGNRLVIDELVRLRVPLGRLRQSRERIGCREILPDRRIEEL